LLEKELGELQSIPGDDILRPIYHGSSFGRQEVNEEFAFAQLDKAVEKIEAIVRQKEALVDKIKLAAEKAYKARGDQPPIGCYYRAKAITLFPVVLASNETQNCSEKLYVPLRENPLFENKYVSLNYSVAHVPTNVYDLCAMWGIQLDEMKLDFFDCRSQPW
uniref:Phosphopyruvate hydratase n=1 Tax=Echinostoma caproni TaxID=27848 RepID=A0A182ZZH9_9TREM